MRSAPYVVPTGTLQGCSCSFLKFGWSRKRSSLSQTAIWKVGCCNSTLPLAEQQNCGVSEVVLMLASIGGSENGPDKYVCKTRKLGMSWHALCCCIRLVLACLASYPGFRAIPFVACGTMKVSRCYGQQMLGWKPGYEANNFRVSCHGGSVVTRKKNH